MTKNARLLKLSMVLTNVLVGILIFSGRAGSQSVNMGKTFDEVVKLAAKEGKVRVGSGLTVEEAPLVLKGFNQKYPMIKVDLTPVSGVACPRSTSVLMDISMRRALTCALSVIILRWFQRTGSPKIGRIVSIPIGRERLPWIRTRDF